MTLSPKFSWKVSGVAVVLALVMLRCAWWQWDRYLQKVELVNTYEQNSTAAAIAVPPEQLLSGDLSELWDRKIELSGSYDYNHQLIVTNKKAASGPGHHVFTPFRLDNSDHAIFVSRGFIPYADRDPESWEKYRFDTHETLQAVLKQSKTARALGPKNPDSNTDGERATFYFFEEIPKMAKALPYPVITGAYVQRIGDPPHGEFPQQAISIEVPPSTHFGYTIEWTLLAVATLGIAFLIQAFPRRRVRYIENSATPHSDVPTHNPGKSSPESAE